MIITIEKTKTKQPLFIIIIPHNRIRKNIYGYENFMRFSWYKINIFIEYNGWCPFKKYSTITNKRIYEKIRHSITFKRL